MQPKRIIDVVTPGEKSASPQTQTIPNSEPPIQEMAADIPSPEVPKFGELQPKIDAHPLFSGTKEPKPKNRRWQKRTLAPLTGLIILLIILYLAIDAGLVKGYSHLPFHFFKAPVAATAPTITPAKTTTTIPASPPAAPDPYAGWKPFSSSAGQFSLKYPSSWVIPPDLATKCANDILLLAPNTQTLGKCAGDGGLGEVSVLSTTGDRRVQYPIKEGDNYTGVTSETVSVQGVAGVKYTGTAKNQPSGPGSLPDNTKTVIYVFYTNSKTYVATYNQLPGYPDALSDFTSIVTGTLKFANS